MSSFLTPTLALLAKYSGKGSGSGPSGSIPPLPALTFAPGRQRAAYKPPAPSPKSAMLPGFPVKAAALARSIGLCSQ